MTVKGNQRRSGAIRGRGINPAQSNPLPDDLSPPTRRVHTTKPPWTGHTTPIDYNLVDTRPSTPFILLAHLIAPFVEIDLMFSPA
jgi:hypothetical protein